VSDDEEDPEVIADLRLRAASEFDRTRTRPTGHRSFSPDPVIGQVPCRGRCGALADWTESAENAFQTWNRVLERRDEGPLDKTRIVFCETCRKLGQHMSAERNRVHVDKLADLIRQLKESTEPESERDLIERIAKLNHPDVAGLVKAIKDARERETGNKRARRSEVTK
jgi:hypothetical protein